MITLILTNFLTLLVYPLAAIMLVGALALALSFTRWRLIGQVLLGLALVALCIAATPITKVLPLGVYPLGTAMLVGTIAAGGALDCGHARFRQLARVVFGIAVSAAKHREATQSDVVVVLGGVAADLGNPADQIMHALRIYRAGKASLIVISGGNKNQGGIPESQLIADLLVDLGASRSALILETESRTQKACHSVPCFEAVKHSIGLWFFSITIANG